MMNTGRKWLKAHATRGGGAVGSGICELLGDVVPEPVVICVGPQVVTSSRQVP